MNYRRLGRAGLKVSELSLGGWITFGGSVTDTQLARDIITTAYDSGINFFDIADVYARGESEKLMGSVLKDFPRHTLVISSKVFWPMSDDPNDRGLSRKHILESVDKSLQRIGTDYLDLYFCHRYDDETPVEETVRAMDDLIHQGKILYWGTSEWTGAQIQEAVDICEKYNLYKPQVEQPQYNILHRARIENEILPVTEPNGIGLVVWSPLASGVLTGKYDDGVPEGSRIANEAWLRRTHLRDNPIEAVRKLKPIADDLGVTRAQLAIAWTLRQPGVSSAITGATKVSQLDDTLAALKITLDDETLRRIDETIGGVEID
ncbi:MAG TPA: aldo/keto reductase [Aggregatilinea sp.]|jgi:voltage-dependent potassium channel beta subunit|uniref:aldo/keto reductase n=1 Tax=Aggregatilinea sp. TaxID=2806333 RepID=UPI002D0FA366|nr:aldo/keto reductase [Aggregatilinea sp.]HML20700.1 aldo/keto reductase [Aggregatilinea sp.]